MRISGFSRHSLFDIRHSLKEGRMEIRGNVFLVTGGGSGLGAACARQLAAAGGNVLVVDIRAEAGRTVAEELGTPGRFVQADVTDEAQADEAVRAAIAAWGRLSGVVNCAGILSGARVVGKEGPHDLA